MVLVFVDCGTVELELLAVNLVSCTNVIKWKCASLPKNELEMSIVRIQNQIIGH
jgi:hypothetical protein